VKHKKLVLKAVYALEHNACEMLPSVWMSVNILLLLVTEASPRTIVAGGLIKKCPVLFVCYLLIELSVMETDYCLGYLLDCRGVGYRNSVWAIIYPRRPNVLLGPPSLQLTNQLQLLSRSRMR
jgi:hypothetical protein